jgi:O-antigen ligase
MDKLFPLKTESQQDIFWGVLAITSMSIFVVASLFLDQSLLLYFFALVLVFLATIMRPSAGIYTIFLCTMWFERHFTLLPLQIGESIYKIYPLDFCILFLVLSLGARFLEGNLKWKNHPLDWFIIVFGVICTIGLGLALFRNLNMALAFGTYKNYFLYAILYFLCVAIFITKEKWKQLFNWLIVGGCGLFIFLFYGLVVGKGLWSEYTPLSTVGERLIAGTHVFYLAIFFFILLSVYLFQNAQNKLSKCQAIMIYTAMSLCGLAFVVSLVRHLWIAIIFVCVFWLIFLPGLRLRVKFFKTAIIVAVISAIMLTAYSFGGKIISGDSAGKTVSETSTVLQERTSMANVIGGEDSSFHWRLSVWQAGYKAWLIHPLFGLGLGYEISGFDNGWPFHVALREIHNDYLGILYQLGIVGFLAMLEWFIYLFYRFLKSRDDLIGEDINEARRLFSFSSVVLLFIVGFSISVYWDINLFVIWWWLALAGLRFLWRQPEVKKIIYEDIASK